MTNEEAKRRIEHQETLDYENNLDALACEMAIAALEKQIAKKPKRRYDDDVCPTCNLLGGNRLDTAVFFWHKYCPICGQKLDWTEKEDNK